MGFQLFSRKSDFNSARNYAAVTGQSTNLSAAQQSLTQNYNQSSTGLNFSISYPLRHAFKRVGLTYSWDKSTITTFSQASANLFQTLAFRSGQIQGAECTGRHLHQLGFVELSVQQGWSNHLQAPFRNGYLRRLPAGWPVRQCSLFQPGGAVQALHRGEGSAPQPGRAQRAWLSRAGFLHPGFQRRCRSPVRPLLFRRRQRTAGL